MNAIAWPLVEFTSRLLDHEEREVVLGDLLETNENAWRGLLDVFGLVSRRQAGLWRDLRPWLAGFALALPSSYLLMTASLSVSCTYQRLVNHKVYAGYWPTGHEGFPYCCATSSCSSAGRGQLATWLERHRDGPSGRVLFWPFFPAVFSCAYLSPGRASYYSFPLQSGASAGDG